MLNCLGVIIARQYLSSSLIKGHENLSDSDVLSSLRLIFLAASESIFAVSSTCSSQAQNGTSMASLPVLPTPAIKSLNVVPLSAFSKSFRKGEQIFLNKASSSSASIVTVKASLMTEKQA